MAKKQGTLLWNRMKIVLGSFETKIVDTGLTQENRNFADMSSGEPPLGIETTTPPLPGTLPASRVQVIPLAPLAPWLGAFVDHGEPFFDPTTQTVKVRFTSGEGGAVVNVLFWNPHSVLGPGDADTYGSPA